MSISHGRLLHANYFLMRKITVTNILKKIKINVHANYFIMRKITVINILKKIKINCYKYSYLMMNAFLYSSAPTERFLGFHFTVVIYYIFTVSEREREREREREMNN